ncbi:MAG TPA: hypothetical protein VNW30_04820 [Opitutaceae bacterium]|jgi:hypothetical protein|nr:hypothetical protein [Opitutaceae bacterium]
MTIDEAAAQYRQAYASKTNAELLHEKIRFNQLSPQYIAATQLLEERRLQAEQKREADEEIRHKAIADKLDELKKPHWTVKPIFWISVVSAIAAILAAYFSYRSIPVTPPTPHREASQP